MRKAIKLTFFPHDGRFWRIDWLGDVRYRTMEGRNSTPSIRVALSSWLDPQLNADKIRNATFPHQTQVYAPVGYLSKLKIGDVWRNGEHVESPPYQTERFRDVSVAPGAASTIKAGLAEKVGDDDVFYLPLSAHPYHINHTGSYCLLVKLPEDKRLIIPATELISFYFGRSSTLINALFHFPLSERDLWIDAEHEAGKLKSKIVLADGISGWSASDIARMAFSVPALQAAQLVGKSLSAANIYKNELYPRAHFPFYGHTTLDASGVWLPFGNSPNRTFLVFKLLSCSHHFPFGKLEYEMTGRAARAMDYSNHGPGSNSASNPREADPLLITAKRGSKNHVEEDPSKNLVTVELVIEKRPQFTDLEYKSVCRVEEPATTADVQILLSTGKSVSAASPGTDGKSGDIRPVDLVQQSDWGKEGSKPHLFMQELVDNLSGSEQYGKVEMVKVPAEDERNLLRCFEEALWQYQLEQLDQPDKKQFLALSNIQIAVVIDGRVKIYLLIAEAGYPSKLTYLCATAMPVSAGIAKTAAVDVIAALAAQGHYEGEDEHGERTQYFMHLPDTALKSEISTAVQYVSRHMELYCDIFQSTVT